MTTICRKSTALVCALVIVSGCATMAPGPPRRQPTVERAALFMDRLTAWGFTGAALAARGDRVVLEGGYGTDPRGRAIPADAIFDAGSLAKQFTAAAVLVLVDRGRLAVTDSIGAFLPAVPDDKRAITLHHLLTHTSGLPREVGRDWEETTRTEFEQRALGEPLVSSPGERHHYSNAGFALLGAIVERVSGRPFHDFLTEEVFRAAGLRAAGFIGRSPDPGRTVPAGSGTLEGQSPADWPHTWNHRGSGGLLITARDLFHWRRALRSGRVLSERSVAAMHTDHGFGYGYGVQISEAEGGPVVHHTGLWYSFTSRFAERSHDSLTVVVLSSRRDGPYQPATVAARDLVDELDGRPGALPPALAGAPAPEHQGTFSTGAGGIVRTRIRDDHLWVTGSGQDVFDALFSDGPPSSDAVTLVRARTLAVLREIGEGASDTLQAVAPRERYERYRVLLPRIWEERADSLGALRGIELVGVVDRGTALDAFATLDWSGTPEGVLLIWSRDGTLLGLANEDPRMDDGLMTFRRTADGDYAAYHFESRRVVRLEIAGDRLAVRETAGGPVLLEALRTGR